jgi:aspartate/methionine/tyrosine aminotransferase
MKLPSFKLEEFWKKYEFSTPYLLCPSDAESWTLQEILDLADPESKQLWNELRLGYTEVPGHPLLREEVAQLYTDLNRDQILIFAGGEEAIYCTMQSLLSPKDHVIIIKPCYQSLEVLPRALGADVTHLVLDPKKKWRLELAAVKDALRSNTKLIVLNYPHNPTGMLLDWATWQGIIHLAREQGCYIFCDEMYRMLEVDEKERLPPIADVYEKGISHYGMAKPFGLAGLRIAWLACQDIHLLEKAASYKLYTSICSSAPSEIIALMALRAKEKILKRNRSIIQENLRLLDSFFARQSKRLSWIRPQSGTIAFPELLLPISVSQFNEKLIEEKGVLIMPGEIFDYPGNFFRIGFGRQNMREALERFEQFLDSHANLYIS